jgi:predicted ribosomally synthesized six-cysteine peptide SCIFF
MKYIKTLNNTKLTDNINVKGCGECQTSCQSACKTSCTVGNQKCEYDLTQFLRPEGERN